MHPENMVVSKLLDENTPNIEKAKSLTAGLSAAQMNWRPQPGNWSIAQNLDHLNFSYVEVELCNASSFLFACVWLRSRLAQLLPK